MVKPTNLNNQSGASDDDDPISDCSSVDKTANSFQTPELAPNETDYGLEYTNSIRNPDKSARNAIQNEDKSTREPSIRKTQNNSTKEKTVAENTDNIIQPGGVKHQRNKQVKNPKQQKQQKEPKTSQKSTAHLRKQLLPQNREKRLLKEVHRLANEDYLIPRLPFSRLVREIMYEFFNGDFKITREALDALQCTSELYVTQRLQDAYLLTLHRGRVTLSIQDLEIINYLRTNV